MKCLLKDQLGNLDIFGRLIIVPSVRCKTSNLFVESISGRSSKKKSLSFWISQKDSRPDFLQRQLRQRSPWSRASSRRATSSKRGWSGRGREDSTACRWSTRGTPSASRLTASPPHPLPRPSGSGRRSSNWVSWRTGKCPSGQSQTQKLRKIKMAKVQMRKVLLAKSPTGKISNWQKALDLS